MKFGQFARYLQGFGPFSGGRPIKEHAKDKVWCLISDRKSPTFLRLVIFPLLILAFFTFQNGCVRRGPDWPAPGPPSELGRAGLASNSIRHVVSKDETLSGIATRYGVDIGELAAVNKLAAPYTIKDGALLIIPKGFRPPETESIQSPKQEQEKEDPAGSKFSWPLDGKVIQPFGSGDQLHRNGITLEAENNLDVRALEAGKVGHVGEIPGLGKVILVDHSERLVSVYAHLHNTKVSVGETVTRNQTIGSLSGSGKSGKPTLYFEVRLHAKPVNPIKFLNSKP